MKRDNKTNSKDDRYINIKISDKDYKASVLKML